MDDANDAARNFHQALVERSLVEARDLGDRQFEFSVDLESAIALAMALELAWRTMKMSLYPEDRQPALTARRTLAGIIANLEQAGYRYTAEMLRNGDTLEYLEPPFMARTQ